MSFYWLCHALAHMYRDCLSVYLFVLDSLFAKYKMVLWPSAWTELSPWRLACVVFYLMTFLVFLSRLMSWAVCGIQFLIYAV